MTILFPAPNAENALVDSVNGQTGAVVLDAADVDADASGAATTAQSNAESFATSAVATETTRAEATEALKVPLAPAPSGDVTGATDTTALQNWLNSLPSSVIDAWISAASPYYINAALTVTTALAIRGNATIIQVTTGTAAFKATAGGFIFDGPTLVGPQYTAFNATESAIIVQGASVSAPISFVRIRNSNFTSWGDRAVYVNYANDVVVSDNEITNIQYSGVHFLTVIGGQIADNKIDSVVGSSSNSGNCYGLSLSSLATGASTADPASENIAVTGNRITNVALWTGIDTHGGINLTISANIVQGCNFGIAAVSTHGSNGTPLAGPQRVKITGNVVDVGALGIGQATYGIIVQGAIVTSGSPIQLAADCSVTGNEINGYGQSFAAGGLIGAITAEATQGLSVTGNTMQNASTCGIALYTDNYGFSVGDNTITDVYSNTNNAFAVCVYEYGTGCVRAGSLRNLGAVQVQASIASASVGQSVSSSTLNIAQTSNNTSPTSVFTSSGSVTVPASGGPVTLAYTGITGTTLTGVTTSGTGTISAGFASQTPAYMNQYGIRSNSSTNSIVYYTGYSQATLAEISTAGGAGSTITTQAAVPPVTFANPSSPTGTVSTTLVMAGLGVAFTPAVTGKVLVRISVVLGASATATAIVKGYYGTGTAPANGVAFTGTAFTQGQFDARPATTGATVIQAEIIGTPTGLTVGTAYWFDFAWASSSGSSTISGSNVVVTIQECA